MRNYTRRCTRFPTCISWKQRFALSHAHTIICPTTKTLTQFRESSFYMGCVHIASQFNPVHAPISFLEYPFLILSSHHLDLSLPSGFFLSGLTTKTIYFPHLSHIATPTNISAGLHIWRGKNIRFCDSKQHRILMFAVKLCVQIQSITRLGTQFASVLRTHSSTF